MLSKMLSTFIPHRILKKKVQCVDILSGVRIYGLYIFNTYMYIYVGMNIYIHDMF